MVVAGGNGQGNQLNQLNGPTYIFVDDDLSLYVSDCGNHRVMKWVKDAKEGVVVAGGNGQGNSLTQLSLPQCDVISDWSKAVGPAFGTNANLCVGDESYVTISPGNLFCFYRTS